MQLKSSATMILQGNKNNSGLAKNVAGGKQQAGPNKANMPPKAVR
jgi:hypothetical protein